MKHLFTLLAISALFTTAFAQNETEIQLYKGTTELIVNGGLDIDTLAGTQIDLDLGMGYFFADNWEAGGILGFSDSDLVSQYGISGFLEYNYDTGTWWIPYYGGRVGYDFFESNRVDVSEGGLGFGGYAGMKYFFPGYRSLALAGQLNINYSTAEIYDTDSGSEEFDVAFTMGLRYFLPQK